MNSFESNREAVDQHHILELFNGAQAELIHEYAEKNGLDDERAAIEWIGKYSKKFREICDNPDCLEGIEKTHESTLEKIKSLLY